MDTRRRSSRTPGHSGGMDIVMTLAIVAAMTSVIMPALLGDIRYTRPDQTPRQAIAVSSDTESNVISTFVTEWEGPAAGALLTVARADVRPLASPGLAGKAAAHVEGAPIPNADHPTVARLL